MGKESDGPNFRSSLRDLSLFGRIPAVETAGYFQMFLRNKCAMTKDGQNKMAYGKLQMAYGLCQGIVTQGRW
jgi:hypothetical protein